MPIIGEGFSASELRHDALQAALRVFGYSHRTAFKQVQEYPLKLTQGDIPSNVAGLARHDDPDITEATTLQFRMALDCGWSHSSASETLELALDGCCCTTMVEQGHGVSQACVKDQPLGGRTNLAARSVTHQSRGFFTPTDEAKRLKRIDDAIVKLQAKQTKRFLGREYVASRLASYSSARAACPKSRFKVGQKCVSQRNAVYNRLGPLRVVKVEQLAKKEKNKRNQVLQSDIDHLNTRRKFLLDRSLQEDVGQLNKISSFVFSSGQLDEFDEVHRRVESSCTTHDLLNQFKDSPEPPSEVEQAMLEEAAPDDDGSNRRNLPGFMSHICRNRDEFLGTIIFAGDGDAPDVCYYPCIASQQPHFVVWIRLVRTLESIPLLSRECHGGLVVGPSSMSKPCFRIDEFLVDSEIGLNDTDELWVISRFDFTEQDNILRFASGPIPWPEFCRHHVFVGGAGHSGPTHKKARITEAVKDALLHEFPWVIAEDLQLKARSGQPSCAGGKPLYKAPDAFLPDSDHGDSSSDHDGSDEHDDDSDEHEDGDELAAAAEPGADVAHVDLHALAGELAAIREEEGDGNFEGMFFFVANRGGAWTMAHHGTAAIAATSFAKALAREFCHKFGWQKQKGWSYKKYHGRPNANFLAREYARRGHHYCSIWFAHGCDDMFVFQACHDAPADPEFVGWMNGLDIVSIEFAEADRIQRLRPI